MKPVRPLLLAFILVASACVTAPPRVDDVPDAGAPSVGNAPAGAAPAPDAEATPSGDAPPDGRAALACEGAPKAPGPRVVVEAEVLAVRAEGLDLAHTRSSLRSFASNHLKACLAVDARTPPGPHGSVELGLTIRARSGSSAVTDAVVLGDTTGRSEVAACVVARVGRMRLPPPDDDAAELDLRIAFNVVTR